MIDLEIIWTALASSYTDNGKLVENIWHRIKAVYGENERIYHNLDHLFFIFTLADSINADFENKDAAYFALFYHDYVYDPESGNNEEKSAEVAENDMKSLGVETDTIHRCVHHILSTKYHEVSTDPDTNYVIDLDLSILGSDADTYTHYAESIRMEYSIFPDEVFYRERHRLLENLLNQQRIFQTQIFYQLFENNARRNISNELKNIQNIITNQEL